MKTAKIVDEPGKTIDSSTKTAKIMDEPGKMANSSTKMAKIMDERRGGGVSGARGRDGRLADHRFAGDEEVLEGFFEVAGVPGVGYVAANAGVGHHQVDFAKGIVRDYAAD